MKTTTNPEYDADQGDIDNSKPWKRQGNLRKGH